MTKFIGIEYGRAATTTITDQGPALAPRAIQQMFPNYDWTFVTPDAFNIEECRADRFGENFKIQQKIYATTPHEPHIFIGGDHSVNYGHFAAIADQMPNTELCLIYLDAHLDIHTPESSKLEASGAPHGTNVRALLGEGDTRWLTLQQHKPVLTPNRVFYIGTRSFEPSEINFARQNNIYIKPASELTNESDWARTVADIRSAIGNRPFVVSVDFDAMDPKYFPDVLVPETDGLSVEAVRYFIKEFHNAHSFEFVEYAPNGDAASARIVQDLIETAIND